jgi:hypothetical protein
MLRVTVREYYSQAHKCTLYMASIGRYRDLLTRGTREQAEHDAVVYFLRGRISALRYKFGPVRQALRLTSAL